MNKDLIDIMKARYEVISALTMQLENKLKAFPSGGIIIRHIGNNTYYYYKDTNSDEKLLHKEDNDLIEMLIQKQYLMKVLRPPVGWGAVVSG